MLWFSRYRFPYAEQCTNPRQSLAETMRCKEFQRIKCDFSGESVRIVHLQPRYFHNYWNSTFVGRFITEGGKHFLVGHFRPSLRLFFLNLAGVMFAAYRFVSLLDEDSGGEAVLHQELVWQGYFFCGLIALMIFGWAIGLPYQRRIVAAIRQSAQCEIAAAVPVND